MRSFEFARKVVDGKIVKEEDERGCFGEVKAYPNAQLPEYSTEHSAGADFFCAEKVTIPSIWGSLFRIFKSGEAFHFMDLIHFPIGSNVVNDIEEVKSVSKLFQPTIVHTGIKSNMEQDEVLELYNRSSNPKNLGLILANGVGVIDADYYNSEKNDGEIMFAFYNIKPWSVTLEVGDKVGQGVFKKYLRPNIGLRVKNVKRECGFGSTDSQ